MFDQRLKDLIIDEVIVTPPHPTEPEVPIRMQLNGRLLDGSTAWIGVTIPNGAHLKWGVPYEIED